MSIICLYSGLRSAFFVLYAVLCINDPFYNNTALVMSSLLYLSYLQREGFVITKEKEDKDQYPLLLTWINFNPSMDK